MVPCSVRDSSQSTNSFSIEKTIHLKEEIDPELIRSMRDGDPMKLTGIPARKAHENDAIPRIAPKWLKHDKQVCIYQPYIMVSSRIII
jgi:hypothetical protein